MLDQHMGMFPRYRRGEFADGPSFHQYYDKCFVVTAAHLDEILAVLKHGVGLNYPDKPTVVDVRGYTRDGERRFSNLSEITSYTNARKERLQSVGISVRPEDKSMMALVRLQDYQPGWSVSVIVEGGDEQASLGLFNKLRNCIEPRFQWYSFLLSTRFWVGVTLVVLVAYAVFLMGPAAMEKLGMYTPAGPEGPAADTAGVIQTGAQALRSGSVRSTFIEVGIMAVIALFFVLVILPHLFPRGLFLIGRETWRAAIISKLRWALLVALIVLPIGAFLLQRAG